MTKCKNYNVGNRFKCIKDKKYDGKIVFKKGNIYEYIKPEHKDTIRDDTFCTIYLKAEDDSIRLFHKDINIRVDNDIKDFEKYFVPIEKWRKNEIKNILKFF